MGASRKFLDFGTPRIANRDSVVTVRDLLSCHEHPTGGGLVHGTGASRKFLDFGTPRIANRDSVVTVRDLLRRPGQRSRAPADHAPRLRSDLEPSRSVAQGG